MIKNLMNKWALKKALKNPKYPEGRSLLALAIVISQSKKKTRELLESMGARKIDLTIKDKEVEGYTLRKKKN